MTLTQTAVVTKRAIVIISVTIFLLIGAKVGYQVWYNYQLANLPAVVDRPEEKFGTLPVLQFPDEEVSSSNFSYTLDTPTGDFPELPIALKVYFIPQAGISLLAPERATSLAQKLGFENGPQILSTTSYQFSDNKGGMMLIDLPTGNFNFQKTIASESAALVFSEGDLEIKNSFKGFLMQKDLLHPEIDGGEMILTFDSDEPQKSKIATISARPVSIDNLSILNGRSHGLVKAELTPDKDVDRRFYKLDYVTWPIDQTTFSSYPLKTPQQALDDLKSGRGFVSIIPLRPQVSITSVSLAYYQSENYTPYLQPVYVFEGPHFQALVQATIIEE